MKATLMYGAGDIRVETVADPVIEQPTDAIVRVVLACVCGSDLHPYRTMSARDRGVPMGHEAIGVVEETGPTVSGVATGDLVVVPFAWSDNTCPVCRDGFHTACPHGGFFSGAQAEFLRVPQASGTLVAVPGGLAGVDPSLLPSLLALSDVYLTGYHAAHMAGVRGGTTVTVIGDGAVGLCAVLAAQRMGAEQVILMGRHAARTDLGRQWGATDVVSQRGEKGVHAVLELTGGLGSDAVLEAVGHMPAYEQAYGVVRPGGVISRVGLPQYEDAPIGFRSLFGKNVTLNGGPAPVRAYLDQHIPLVLDGTINPGRVFDAEVSLDDVAKGYLLMDSREKLKVLVHP